MTRIEEFEEKQRLEKEAFLKQEAEREAREARRKAQRNEFDIFRDSCVKELMDDPDYKFNETAAAIIFEYAWQEGHSYGFNEVHSYMNDYAEMVYKVIKAI